MIKIYIKHTQAILEQMFEFPDHGLVQFIGENSNGKSILGKVLSLVLFQNLTNDDQRLPIIHDDHNQATLGMEYDNKKLIVIISRDLDACLYQLVRSDGTIISKRVRDDKIDELLREFGFLIYKTWPVCLQLCETFGPMPFVNDTTGKYDGEIVNSIVSDPQAEAFLYNYAFTFKEATAIKNSYKNELAQLRARRDKIRIRDNTEKMMHMSAKLKRLCSIHQIIKPINLVDVPYVPVLYFDMPIANKLKPLYMPYFMEEMIKSVYNFDIIFDELDKMERGVCPACGKKYLDTDECGH